MSPDPNADRGDECSAIDLASLLERCMGSTPVALLVLEKFGSQLCGDIEALRLAYDLAQADEIARIAHRLKGAAGTVCAADLAAASAALEHAARQERGPVNRSLLGAVESQAVRCELAIPAAVEALRAGAA